MKTFSLAKAGLLIAGLSSAFWAVESSKHNETIADCNNVMQINEQGSTQLVMQCIAVPQQSWLSWFQGQSRSTQFHFIDLLELLNRMNSPAAAN
jgi:hypothetical protein